MGRTDDKWHGERNLCAGTWFSAQLELFFSTPNTLLPAVTSELSLTLEVLEVWCLIHRRHLAAMEEIPTLRNFRHVEVVRLSAAVGIG